MRGRLIAWSAVLAVPILVWAASFASVLWLSRAERAGPSDAVVVLGAAQYNGRPSPVFRARLEHAYSLWRRGFAPLLVVTGGVGQRDSLSEAETGAAWLRRFRSVPDSALLVEPTGRHSESSLRAVSRRLKARGAQRVILVSDGFHLCRLSLLARRLGLDPRTSPARSSPIGRSRKRELGYLIVESLKTPIAFIATRSE